MRNLQKRVCQVIMVGMVLLGCQSMVWAADEPERITQPFDLTQVNCDISGSGWQWQNEQKILTFNGINLRMNYPLTSKEEMENADAYMREMSLFTVPAETTLVLKDGSKNTINMQAKAAIKAQGKLTITGDGELSIKNISILGGDAIAVRDGDLIVNGGKFELDVHDVGFEVLSGDCIFNNGQFSMTTNNSNPQNFTARVIEANDITINGGIIETKNELATGINAEGTLKINGGKIDLLMANEMATGDALSGECIVINEGEVDIRNAGTGLTISGSEKGSGLEINGGSIRIIGGGRGLILGEENQLQMSGGEMHIDVQDRAISGLADDNLAPKMVVNGGKLYVKGRSAVAWMMLEPGEKDLSSQLIAVGDNMVMETDGIMKKSKYTINYVEGKEDYYVYSLVPEGWAAEQTTCSIETDYGVKSLNIIPKDEEQGEEKNAKVEKISFYVDGLPISFASANDGSIYIDENGRTMVPLRTLTQAMGYRAEWDEEKQSITIQGQGEETVVFILNQKTYWVNGEEHQMDTQAISLPPGRTYVPLRFVAESLGAQVEMSSEADGTAKIMITTGK